MSRNVHREAKARRTREAVASAYASKRETTALTLGRAQSIQNLMSIQTKANNDRFEQLFKLHQVVQDPAAKTLLQEQMTAIATAPLTTFKSAEQELYGSRHDPITLDESASDDAGEALPIPEAETVLTSDSGNIANTVLRDVVHQQGYVIISDVVKPPKDDGWWRDMVKDLNTLFNTNNNVSIFNGMGKKNDNHRSQILFSEFDVTKKYPGTGSKKRSDPETLQRVKRFVDPWFAAMEHQIRSLGLLVPPRTRGENKLLVGYPPCDQQKLHWDFDPDIVSKLIENKNSTGIPISCICSFTPTG